MTGADLLRFFEGLYYTKLPAGDYVDSRCGARVDQCLVRNPPTHKTAFATMVRTWRGSGSVGPSETADSLKMRALGELGRRLLRCEGRSLGMFADFPRWGSDDVAAAKNFQLGESARPSVATYDGIATRPAAPLIIVGEEDWSSRSPGPAAPLRIV